MCANWHFVWLGPTLLARRTEREKPKMIKGKGIAVAGDGGFFPSKKGKSIQ